MKARDCDHLALAQSGQRCVNQVGGLHGDLGRLLRRIGLRSGDWIVRADIALKRGCQSVAR